MTNSNYPRRPVRLRKNERGAILIQVAVALLALLALSSFVFDYGVMWVSKGQAQNVGGCRCAVGCDFARVQQLDRPGRGARPRDCGWRRETGSGARRRTSRPAM